METELAEMVLLDKAVPDVEGGLSIRRCSLYTRPSVKESADDQEPLIRFPVPAATGLVRQMVDHDFVRTRPAFWHRHALAGKKFTELRLSRRLEICIYRVHILCASKREIALTKLLNAPKCAANYG